MSARLRQPWYLCWWLVNPQARVHVTNSQLTYAITASLFFALFILFLLVVQFMIKANPPHPRIQYIPMAQFNRGNVNKGQVLENLRKSLEKIADFQTSDLGGMKVKNPKPVFHDLLQMMTKREKRQFLTLEAFNIFDMDDFESLVALGYESNHQSNNTPNLNYYSLSKMVEYVTPNYEKLCHDIVFTLTDSKRPVEDTFCARLKILGSEILKGTEPPLLTLYTWWPDPITDPEVLSKRAVIANWNLLRPFVIPVVFTNCRMNMAVANGQNWPCLPVEAENVDQLPVFKHTAYAMDHTFNSTFRGYAMANSMFDSSLIQTLLSIKDRFVSVSLDPSKESILIYGNAVNMPALGLETFENHENFHKRIEAVLGHNTTSSKCNYVIYRGMEFSDYESVVVDDDYLIPYLVKRSMQNEQLLINTTETILSAKTYRHRAKNEWGRRFIKLKPRDNIYNKKIFDLLKGKKLDSKVKPYKTIYNQRNGIQAIPLQ